MVYSAIIFFLLSRITSIPHWKPVFGEGSPDILQYLPFNMKHRAEKELASDGFVLTPDRVKPEPDLLQKRQCWERLALMQTFLIIHHIFSLLGLKAVGERAKFSPSFTPRQLRGQGHSGLRHMERTAVLVRYSLHRRPLLQSPLGASDCLAQKYHQTPWPGATGQYMLCIRIPK